MNCLSLFKRKPLVQVVLTKEKAKKRPKGSAQAGSATYTYFEKRLNNIECKLEQMKMQTTKIFQDGESEGECAGRKKGQSKTEGLCVTICDTPKCQSKTEGLCVTICDTNPECGEPAQSEPRENESTPSQKKKKQKNEAARKEEKNSKKETDACADQNRNKEAECEEDTSTKVCNVAAPPLYNQGLFSDGCLPSARPAESTETPAIDDSALSLILKTSERNVSVSEGALNRNCLSETADNSLGDTSGAERIRTVHMPDGSKRNVFALQFDESLTGSLKASKIILHNKNAELVEYDKSAAHILPTETILSKGSSERVEKASSSVENSPGLTVLNVCPTVIGKRVTKKSGKYAAAADLVLRKKSSNEGATKTQVVFPRWPDSSMSRVYLPKKAVTAQNQPLRKRLILMRRSGIEKEDVSIRKRNRRSKTRTEHKDSRTDQGADDRDGSGLEDTKERQTVGRRFKRGLRSGSSGPRNTGSKSARTEPSERPTRGPTVVGKKPDETDLSSPKSLSNPSLESDSESKAPDAESAEKGLCDVSDVRTSVTRVSKISMNKIVSNEIESESRSTIRVESKSELSKLYFYNPVSGSYVSFATLMEIPDICPGETRNRLSNRSATESGKTEPCSGTIYLEGPDGSRRLSTRKTKYPEKNTGDPNASAKRTAPASNDPIVITADLEFQKDISTGCRNGSAHRVESAGSMSVRDGSGFRVRAHPPDSPPSNKTDSTETVSDKTVSSSDTQSKLNENPTVGQDRDRVTTQDDASRSPVVNRVSVVYGGFPDRVEGSRSDGRISAPADLPVLTAALEDKNPSEQSRANVLGPSASDYGAAEEKSGRSDLRNDHDDRAARPPDDSSAGNPTAGFVTIHCVKCKEISVAKVLDP